MELETVFIILGGVLVASALITSFLGLRSDKFPGSPRAVAAMLGTVAAVVVVTGFVAINVGAEELEHKKEVLAEVEADEGDTETDSADADAGDDDPDEIDPNSAGAEIFTSTGCGNCHALSDAGTSAAVGPSLDSALQGESEDFVRTSIIDPSAEIEQGYENGIMPQDYADTLSPEDLDTLVAYLAEVGGADGAGRVGDSGEVEGG